jgi:hypothetical protein
VAEREETADAVGVVGDGAVADSTVVVGGTSVEDGSWVPIRISGSSFSTGDHDATWRLKFGDQGNGCHRALV